MGKDAIVHTGRKSIQQCTSCSIYFQLRAARCISTSGAFRYLFGVRRDGEVDWRGACREKKLLPAQLLRSQNFQPLRSNPFAMDSSQVVFWIVLENVGNPWSAIVKFWNPPETWGKVIRLTFSVSLFKPCFNRSPSKARRGKVGKGCSKRGINDFGKNHNAIFQCISPFRTTCQICTIF